MNVPVPVPVPGCFRPGAGSSGSFGDVEHDRGGRPVELIFQVRSSLWRRFEDPIDEVQELDCALVRVQLLVVEPAPVVGKFAAIVAQQPGTGTGKRTGNVGPKGVLTMTT